MLLYYSSGLYGKTLGTPRKYLPHINKALRHYNLKVVPNKNTISKRFWVKFLPFAKPKKEPLLEGGTKIILNPKGMSAEFIDSWTTYREDYWIDAAERKEDEKLAPEHANDSTTQHHHGRSNKSTSSSSRTNSTSAQASRHNTPRQGSRKKREGSVKGGRGSERGSKQSTPVP